MSLNTLPNELILHLGGFLPSPSLSTLIQTQKRFATLLTPYLYDDEISFQAEHPDFEHWDPGEIPLQCFQCLSRWQSDIILGYLRSQLGPVFTLADKHHRTLLHHVAKQGNTKLVEILLAKGADIEARDSSNATPLLSAAYSGNEGTVDALLNGGADVTVFGTVGITVLVSAIFSRNISVVQRVIEALKTVTDDIFAPCTSGDVLHRAVFIGSEPITRLILDNGADPSAADSYGTTALNGALIWDNDKIATLLLDRGADVLPVDSLGRSALSSAAISRNLAIFERLVQSTLAAGGDISLPHGSDAFTPLHYYAIFGNLTAVERLIESGADVSARGASGATALTCALARLRGRWIIQEKICRVLIQGMNAAGVDFSVPADIEVNALIPWDGFGVTYLHLAADIGVESLVKLLVESGADVLALDSRHQLPLLLAMLSDHEAVCIFLVQEMRARGHDFSSPLPVIPGVTEVGDTLLRVATSRQMTRLCQLLELGAGVTS